MGEWELLCHHSFDLFQILPSSSKLFWTYVSKGSFPKDNRTHWNSDRKRSPTNLNRGNEVPGFGSFQDCLKASARFSRHDTNLWVSGRCFLDHLYTLWGGYSLQGFERHCGVQGKIILDLYKHLYEGYLGKNRMWGKKGIKVVWGGSRVMQ